VDFSIWTPLEFRKNEEQERRNTWKGRNSSK
jgi:hypothetical protein